jgi:anthranilate phosphoribosyltransferase
MIDELRTAVGTLLERRDLSADQMRAAVGAIMSGSAEQPVAIAALLTALKMKGESIDELVGAAQAMRECCTRIPTQRPGLLDTCGTGGDELFTFNISTATALVAAAAGVPVAKHGNRGVSSSSGSADVLERLGVNVQASVAQVARCIDEVGIGFCFAPISHGAMKHAAPVRKELGFRTIFNLVGPLTNPAGAEYQLVGTNRPETAEKLAGALARLGLKRAVVVCGAGQLDEVSLWGETAAFIVSDSRVEQTAWMPDTFGLPECRVADLRVQSPDESAQVIRSLLAGQSGPQLDMVLANAAAALFATGQINDLRAGVERAAEAVASGKAGEVLRRLAELSHQ